jgi:glycopeptide antibiotics resistance protein
MSNITKSLIDIIALIIIYMVFFYRKWKERGKDKLLVNTLLYLYFISVLYVTLMPIIASLPYIVNHPYRFLHIQPFGDLISGRGDAVRQVLLNIIMMMPFGFLIPIVKKQKLFVCVFKTFLFSLGIELLQPLLHGTRSSDITDLITNTIGGMIGYLLYLVFKPLVTMILKRLTPTNHVEGFYNQ